MGKPAARLTDMHVCPMVTVLVPHVGGPIVGPGAPTVLIGSLPAATMSSMCICTGPPDVIVLGSTGVFLGGLPAARMGDMTAHGGTIAVGLPTVMIGEIDIAMLVASIQKLILLMELELLEAIINMIKELLPKVPSNDQKTLAQVLALLLAAHSGVPAVAICE